MKEINEYLTHLAVERHVSASTQSQALAALLFLYRDVLGEEVPWLTELERAPRGGRAPVVLTREEVRRLLGQMSGTAQLVARLLYGTGMRLLEGLRLRVKDLDFETGEVVVRAGKGNKDRATTLPRVLSVGLQRHMERVRALHDRDVAEGFGRVWMPDALEVKYPNANASWSWQWVFPAGKRSIDPRSGMERRHHPRGAGHPARRARRGATGGDCEGGDAAHAAPLLRHAPSRVGPRASAPLQELMGHADVKTTMIYTHVLGLGASGVRNPLDALGGPEADSPSQADG